MSIRSLRRKVGKHTPLVLPPMHCDDGCGDCCGIVPATEKEYQAVMQLAESRGITPLLQGITCPFFQDGRCAVYEARPTICRLFGHIPSMPCPRGRNVDIDQQAARDMLIASGKASRFLHESLQDKGVVSDWMQACLPPENEGTSSPI